MSDEIPAAWRNENGQGHRDAVARGRWCVVVALPSEAYAVLLARLFVRTIFAISTCTHWDGETLSLYVGDAGSNAPAVMEACRSMVVGFLVGAGLMGTAEAAEWKDEAANA